MSIPPRIKRIVFTRPGVAECTWVDESLTIAKPTEVIVRNLHSLVSAGTELACLGGKEWWFPLPGTPGYAAVGEVVATGAAVTKVVPGDVVLTHGPHAEYFRIDTTDRYTGTCIKLPAGLAPELAPLARLASIAITAVRVARIELGDCVLVTGLGLVGNLAAQLAHLQGGTVIGVDLNEKRRALAQGCGLPHAIDSGRPDWKNAVRDIAGSRGITTFIDATGLSPVIAEASTLIAPRGEAVLLGTPRAPHQADLTEVFRGIHLPGFVTYKGALEWRYPTFTEEFEKHSVERNSRIIMELAAAGKLVFDRLLTHRVAPERAPEIYGALQAAQDDYLGVVFDWTGRPPRP